MSPEATSNPIGPFRLRQVDNAALLKPAPGIDKKQDADQAEANSMGDLDKVTQPPAKA
jgi:hypothetical protein